MSIYDSQDNVKHTSDIQLHTDKNFQINKGIEQIIGNHNIIEYWKWF